MCFAEDRLIKKFTVIQNKFVCYFVFLARYFCYVGDIVLVMCPVKHLKPNFFFNSL